MLGRRILYLIALLSVAAFHLAFGQYVSHYMLWFVLLLPVVSLLLSLPAILSTRVQLTGADDVQRGRACSMRLLATCTFFLPLDCLKVRIERLQGLQAYAALVPSISGKRWDAMIADGLHETENALASCIPVWHLECLPDEAAARICNATITE